MSTFIYNWNIICTEQFHCPIVNLFSLSDFSTTRCDCETRMLDYGERGHINAYALSVVNSRLLYLCISRTIHDRAVYWTLSFPMTVRDLWMPFLRFVNISPPNRGGNIRKFRIFAVLWLLSCTPLGFYRGEICRQSAPPYKSTRLVQRVAHLHAPRNNTVCR